MNVFTPTLSEQDDIAKISFINGEWEMFSRLNTLEKEQLENRALILSTSASSRIEGLTIKDYETERLLSGLSIKNLKKEEEKEIKGYLKCLLFLREEYLTISFSLSLIKKLALILLGSSEYRKEDSVEQNILSGEPELNSSPQEEIGTQMEALIKETEKNLSSTISIIYTASIFVLEFLKINPFKRGNGRLSRLLFYYFLLKGGFSFVAASALETQIEESRKTYLYSLRNSQEEGNAHQFVSYLQKVLLKSAIRLELRLYKEIEGKGENIKVDSNLTPLEGKIIESINENGSLYTYQIFSYIDGVKLPTLKKALSSLSDRGLIKRKGKGRGTYYSI